VEIGRKTDHQGDESTDEDSGNATPHTKGDTSDDRERNMIHSTDTTMMLLSAIFEEMGT